MAISLCLIIFFALRAKKNPKNFFRRKRRRRLRQISEPLQRVRCCFVVGAALGSRLRVHAPVGSAFFACLRRFDARRTSGLLFCRRDPQAAVLQKAAAAHSQRDCIAAKEADRLSRVP